MCDPWSLKSFFRDKQERSLFLPVSPFSLDSIFCRQVCVCSVFVFSPACKQAHRPLFNVARTFLGERRGATLSRTHTVFPRTTAGSSSSSSSRNDSNLMSGHICTFDMRTILCD